MLNKIFGIRNSNGMAKPTGPKEKQSRALKIIHPGGHTESYYMAIPAASIMEKNPHFVLARPEIFRRPWDSIVRAEDILVPGQRYYLVPRRTVRKLRRRIGKTSGSGRDKVFCETASDQSKDSVSSSVSGILVKPGLKVKARNLHVRFFGIETNNQLKPGSALKARNGKKVKKSSEEKPDQVDEKYRRARNEYAWEPSLHSITE